MNFKLQLAMGLTCIILSSCAFAKVEQWKWYYATPGGLGDYKSDMRYGRAELTISDGKISGHLIELRAPDIQIPLSGSISGDNVTVVLPTFFPSYVIEFSGKVRAETYERCKYEEIRLQYEMPNGETMVISRTTGDCIE